MDSLWNRELFLKSSSQLLSEDVVVCVSDGLKPKPELEISGSDVRGSKFYYNSKVLCHDTARSKVLVHFYHCSVSLGKASHGSFSD